LDASLHEFVFSPSGGAPRESANYELVQNFIPKHYLIYDIRQDNQENEHIGLVSIVLIIILGIGYWYFYLNTLSFKCVISIQADSEFTEELALQISQKALYMNGKKMEYFVPVTYWENGEQYFARNKLSPQEGYVLWNDNTTSARFDYIVRMERSGSHVYLQCKKGQINSCKYDKYGENSLLNYDSGSE
jgi:hypothetical protein